MLDTTMKEQLASYLASMKQNVTLQLNLDERDKSDELAQLADDIADASGQARLLESTRDTNERAPLMTLSNAAGHRVRFAGVPLGHEFTSLVLALLHLGGHPPKEDEALQARIRDLDETLEFEAIVSLGCQTCPEVVQSLNMMAALNTRVSMTMIDGELFQDEVEARNVMAVPTVFRNGEKFSQGRIGAAEILQKLGSTNTARDVERLNAKAPYDMLVVGGGPAGASAAIYAARKGLRTGIVGETFGGQVMDTLGIENFISVKATEGPKLVASLEEHVKEYDVDIMEGQHVTDVTEKEPDDLHRVTLASGASLQARSVMLATGARWRELGVPGEDDYKGHGVAYCPHCDGPLFKGKRVAVIGGGNSGIEAAIDLAGIVEHVTVLEFADSLKADQVLQDKATGIGNIDVLTQAQTLSIEGDGQRVTGLCYKDRRDDSEHSLALAGVFVQIGLVPNTGFLTDSIATNAMGEVIVDEHGATSVPGVFAAGDVTAGSYKQIVIAMGSGANAALGAFDHLIRQSVPATEAA